MFQYLSLNTAEAQQIESVLELQQAAQEFRWEVEKRQAHEDYCQWYYRLAEQNRAEHVSMQNDVDFFGWFCNRHEGPP